MKKKTRKVDSKGNKLKEAIGTGVDHTHYKKVKEARETPARITFKIPQQDKKVFKEMCEKEYKSNLSDVLRMFIDSFICGNNK